MSDTTSGRPTDEERVAWRQDAARFPPGSPSELGAVYRRTIRLDDEVALLRAERDALRAQVAALVEALCPVCWQPYLHDWESDDGGRPTECRRCEAAWSHEADSQRCPKVPLPPWEAA